MLYKFNYSEERFSQTPQCLAQMSNYFHILLQNQTYFNGPEASMDSGLHYIYYL